MSNADEQEKKTTKKRKKEKADPSRDFIKIDMSAEPPLSGPPLVVFHRIARGGR